MSRETLSTALDLAGIGLVLLAIVAGHELGPAASAALAAMAASAFVAGYYADESHKRYK